MIPQNARMTAGCIGPLAVFFALLIAAVLIAAAR